MGDNRSLEEIIADLERPAGIPFTQFLMPDGRKRKQWIRRPADIEKRALALIERGVSFEMELLGDYRTVSFTTQIEDQEEPLAIELAQNGPPVLTAIDALVAATENALTALRQERANG